MWYVYQQSIGGFCLDRRATLLSVWWLGLQLNRLHLAGDIEHLDLGRPSISLPSRAIDERSVQQWIDGVESIPVQSEDDSIYIARKAKACKVLKLKYLNLVCQHAVVNKLPQLLPLCPHLVCLDIGRYLRNHVSKCCCESLTFALLVD